MSNVLYHIFPNEPFVDLTLYQYGWEKCDPLHSFGPSVRNHYLFHYVISGTGTLSATDFGGATHEYRVRSCDGFMIFPKQVCTYYADETHPWEYTWLEFDGLKVKETLELAGISVTSPIYHPNVKELGLQLRDTMLHITQNSDLSPFQLIGQLYLFVDYLTRSSSRRHLARTGRLQDFYVREALTFVEQNFQNDITVEDIAAFCNLNRSYFSKIFRDAVGQPPQEFLINYRMTKAAELLKITNLPIGTISSAVGYPSQLHFSRAFKNTYGMAPKEWRNEHKIIEPK